MRLLMEFCGDGDLYCEYHACMGCLWALYLYAYLCCVWTVYLYAHTSCLWAVYLFASNTMHAHLVSGHELVCMYVVSVP